MAKSIITIGIDIPSDKTKYTPLKSKLSLLDYDIAIFDPTIRGSYEYPKEYLGKPWLDDYDSFQLKEHLEHWRREILDAVRAGKTVIILLNELEDVYVATGKVSHSGTGRNRQTTTHLEILSNYALVPSGLDVCNSNGKSMRLHEKDSLLTAYWSEMCSLSEYRVLINGDTVRPLVKTKTGNRTVGAYRRYKDASGSLILLPYINFDRKEFFKKKKDETYWSDKAIQAGQKFISCIIGIDKSVRENTEFSIAPEWTKLEEYTLPKEQEIQEDLLKLEAKLESIQKKKESKQQELSEESSLKRLLYEKGTPLEVVVRDILKTMGFDVSNFDNGESEFDVVFESPEGRLLGEVEGKDNKAINIEKLRQLAMNIHEDLQRDEVDQMAKGALIGNAHRLTPPDERGDFFTAKCLKAATSSNTVLIRSIDLFYIGKYLSEKNDKIFATKCRKAILDSTGIVTFPPIPEKSPKKKDKISSTKSK